MRLYDIAKMIKKKATAVKEEVGAFEEELREKYPGMFIYEWLKEDAYTYCGKLRMRSLMWDIESWLNEVRPSRRSVFGSSES